MIELDPPPPPAPASAASVGGLSAGEYQSDDGSVETKSIRSSSTNKPIGAYPSRRPPGVGLAEATRLNAIEHEQRVEALRAEQFQREMQECTFAPRLFTAGRRSEEQGDGSTVQSNMPLDNEADDSTLASIQSICSSSAAGSSLRLPVHERLYALKSKLPDSIARQKHRRKEDVELDECTFTPNVPTRVPAPPPPIFSEGVEKAIPVLAESAGVRILDGGDIVFGSSIPIAVQSLPQPATRPHPQRARSPPREPVPQQVPPPPPRRSSEAMMRSSELGLPPHADRNSSFISVIDEFKQSSAYMSPSKAAGRRGSMRPFSPEVAVDLSGTDDGVDDGSGFVGFSFRDMETAVNRYEKSLRSVSGYSARLERSESSGSGAHSIHGDAKQPKGAEGSRVPSVPHGFAESVVRARLSREQRLRKQHAKEELGKFNEDNYRRSRAAAAKGAKPFHFHATHTKASAARAINLTEVPLEVVSPSSPVRPLPR